MVLLKSSIYWLKTPSLTWKPHLSHINQKISRALFSLKQVKHFLPKQYMKTLCYSLIHSHLSYGSLVWRNVTQLALPQTILLQKRAIRLINNAKYNSHTDLLFRSSRIVKLAESVEYQAALLAFDLNTRKLPILFNDIFTFNRDCQTTVWQDSLPLISIPKIWNKWMNVLTYQITRGHFKYQLKTYIIDTYPERVKCYNLRCNDSYRWPLVIINPVTSNFISFVVIDKMT